MARRSRPKPFLHLFIEQQFILVAPGAGIRKRLPRFLSDFKPVLNKSVRTYTTNGPDVGISYGSFGYKAQSDSKNGQAISFNTVKRSGIELA